MLKRLFLGIVATLVFVYSALPVRASGTLGVMTLELNPNSGLVGTKITISGKNATQTPLSVWLAPQSDQKNSFQLTGSVLPNQDGTWQVQLDIPREWPKHVVVPGRYLVTVQDQNKSYVNQGEFAVLSTEGASPSPVAPTSKPSLLQSFGRNSIFPILGLILILGALGWAVNYFAKKTS